MEEMGGDFYEAFAVATEEPKVRQLCQRLAAVELNHRNVFQQMRSELARRGRTILVPADYLATMRQRARKAIVPDPDTIRQMLSKGDTRSLLDMAVQMEQDSIRFYSSFIDSVPDRGILEAIIREEQEHLRLLQAAGLGEEIRR